MVLQNLREGLPDGCIIFDSPSFDSSIIGVSTDGRAVYRHDLMIAELVLDEKMTEEEAYEFIDYNTIRMLDYMDSDKKPVIVDNIYEYTYNYVEQ